MSWKKLLKKPKGKLTENEKRIITYNYLRSVGYTADEARKLRKRFSLVSVARKRGSKENVVSKRVYRYYRDELGFSPKEAGKRRNRRLKVFDDHIEYVRKNNRLIWDHKKRIPKIPSELYNHGAQYLAKMFHYISPQKKLSELIKEFSAMNPDKMAAHIYRINRFIAKLPKKVELEDGTIIDPLKDFAETLDKQSSIDDYYKSMEKNS